MAIFHTHVSSGSRAGGQSAAVKVGYILREGAYRRRDDRVTWGSGNMPAWASEDPRRLFAAADAYERANGRLFVHVWVALPNELTPSERHELVLDMVAALTGTRLPYVYAVHAGDPKSGGEPANPHAHFVINERVNDGIARDERQWFRRANPKDPAAGGARKDRSLKEVAWVDDVRTRVAALMNEHLERAGHEARVTADSHATRIAVAESQGDAATAEYLRHHPPGMHLGPAAAAMERNRYRGKEGEERKLARLGEPTERGNLARAKAAEEERLRGELRRVSQELRLAREEEHLAKASVAAARSAGLSDAELLRIYEESESAAAGSGWKAVENAAERQVEERRAARLDALQGRPAGRELYVARLTALVRAEEDPTEAQVGRALEEAEADHGRLERAAKLHEKPWGRSYYVAAASSLGERFTLQQVDDTMTGAESFASGVRGLSEAGRTVFETAAKKRGEEAAASELVAALERAQEADREEERERVERRRVRVAGREREVRATKNGPSWLREAAKRVLPGGDRPPTMEEREQIVKTVERRIRTDLDRRRTDLRSAKHGARFLDDALRSAGAVETLAAKERLVEAAERGVREFEEAEARRSAREQRLLRQRGGRDLYCALLTDLDPRWRDKGETTVANVDEALAAAESDAERLRRLGDVLEDRAEAARYRKARDERGEHFTVQDIDAGVDAVLRDRKRRELDRQESRVRATSAGEQRLKKERRARFGATRWLTLDEELSVVKAVETQIQEELGAREVAIEAAPGGRAMLRRVEEEPSAARDLAGREKSIHEAEQVLRATDAVEARLPTTPDPEQPGHRVAVVSDALLAAVRREDDDPFVGDVMSVLGARYAQPTRKGAAGGGYAAAAREDSARRHFGSALVDAFEWCVLKIREIILAACHRVLNGVGGSGSACRRRSRRWAGSGRRCNARPSRRPARST